MCGALGKVWDESVALPWPRAAGFRPQSFRLGPMAPATALWRCGCRSHSSGRKWTATAKESRSVACVACGQALKGRLFYRSAYSALSVVSPPSRYPVSRLCNRCGYSDRCGRPFLFVWAWSCSSASPPGLRELRNPGRALREGKEEEMWGESCCLSLF
jgi:hypothetical protein